MGGFGMEAGFLDCTLFVIQTNPLWQFQKCSLCSEITVVQTNMSGPSGWTRVPVNQWFCLCMEHLARCWDGVGKDSIPIHSKGLRIITHGTHGAPVNRTVTQQLYSQLERVLGVVVGVSSWPWFTLIFWTLNIFLYLALHTVHLYINLFFSLK